MGQFERLIIGLVITISAYRFLYDSQQRHYFHTTLTTYLQCWNCTKCYCCLQNIRLAISGLIFTAGISLVLDTCIHLGILVQIGMLALEALKLKHTSCLCVYQNVLVHLLLLVILLANLSRNKKNNQSVQRQVRAESPKKAEVTAELPKKVQAPVVSSKKQDQVSHEKPKKSKKK